MYKEREKKHGESKYIEWRLMMQKDIWVIETNKKIQILIRYTYENVYRKAIYTCRV